MNTHRLVDWEEDDFKFGLLLLASHLEDYQLAFWLNKAIGTSFFNKEESLVSKIKNTYSQYSYFESKQTSYTPHVYLIDNLSFQNNEGQQNTNLFKSSSLYQSYFLPAQKKWHYILFSEDCYWLESLKIKNKTSAIIYVQHLEKESIKRKDIHTLTSVFHDK